MAHVHEQVLFVNWLFLRVVLLESFVAEGVRLVFVEVEFQALTTEKHHSHDRHRLGNRPVEAGFPSNQRVAVPCVRIPVAYLSEFAEILLSAQGTERNQR